MNKGPQLYIATNLHVHSSTAPVNTCEARTRASLPQPAYSCQIPLRQLPSVHSSLLYFPPHPFFAAEESCVVAITDEQIDSKTLQLEHVNLIHESSVLIFGALLDDTEPMIYLTLNMYVVNNKLARSSSTLALIQSKLIFLYIYISSLYDISIRKEKYIALLILSYTLLKTFIGRNQANQTN